VRLILHQSATLEIANSLLKAAIIGQPPREAREAFEARARLYIAAAELHRPRDVEVLFSLARAPLPLN
jgi:hypothetical protein